LNVYVPDTDASFKQAVAAGAKAAVSPRTRSGGDRYGRVIDPFGYTWGSLHAPKDSRPTR